MSSWIRVSMVGALLVCGLGSARAQAPAPGPATNVRHITLSEAVQLALKHNHLVKIAGYKIEESQYAKDKAKSGYFPLIRNDSSLLKITDTQFIQISKGELGTINGVPNPDQSATLNQGGKTFVTSGTQLVQPLTQLFTKVKPANDIARANLDASRASAKETENEIALKVHEIYYRVLIAQLHRSAVEARMRAAQELESQRGQEVQYGSSLQQDLIESRAQGLQAKQEMLSTELALSDLTLQLNDAIGVPLTTQLELDPGVPPVQSACEREECVKIALAAHPEISVAREEVRKAQGSVQLSKAEFIPDVSALARYSYSSDIPFLARNFGTFGVVFSYDLFDGGRRRAELHESNSQLDEAKENLARVTDEIEVRVQTASNKLERTREMVKVSEELLSLRTESSRTAAQQMEKGSALKSQVDAAVAQEFDAKTMLLQSQLDYIQAQDELTQAIGRTPE
ncbi:MAG TPA: TolC family protein [Candidatus Acidoferrales bacterium]